MEKLQQYFDDTVVYLNEWSTSPGFYIQFSVIFGAVIFAYIFSRVIRNRIPFFQSPPESTSFVKLKSGLYKMQNLVFAVLIIVFLIAGTAIAAPLTKNLWLIKAAQSIAAIFLLYRIITSTVQNGFIKSILKYIGIPIAVLKIFGWLEPISAHMDAVSFEVGNIRISLLVIFRSVILGVILFWLGRHSNNAGQKAIRGSQKLDVSTKELFAKLFEIGLFVILFILLLQIVGINLTTLTVLGGAIGVGLGFGLQQIAANFISGIIILLDRAITVGDHIELDDDKFGIVREIKMRFTVVESYAGKEIMIPNETFITSKFINWSHKDDKQRYDFTFGVAYKTDLHKLFDLVRKVVASHPQVISGEGVPVEELPDAEIDDFADSGINILVEYWMHGIDDGRNRVTADLRLMLWEAFKENNIEFPFPQREVRIIGDVTQGTS